MRLRRLTGLERHKIEEELAELREKIAWYKKVLGDVDLVLQIVKDELAEVRAKFADKRRTEIASAARDLDVEDLIAEEDMVVTITKAGYVKRLPVATYRQQKRGGKGLQGVNLKRQRLRRELSISSTHDHVLFFSNKGKVYRLKVHELPVGLEARAGYRGGQPPAVRAEREDRGGHHHQGVLPPTTTCCSRPAEGMVKKTNMQAYSRVLSTASSPSNCATKMSRSATPPVRPPS